MSKRFWTRGLSAVACLTAAAGVGAELGYPVYPLKEAPALDGRWDGQAWAGIPAAVGFTSVKTGEIVPTRPTAFRMGWHGDSLYLAVRCTEPEPDTIQADPDNYRDGWYADDNLEFFFAADPKAEPRQFVTNSRAARWSNFEPPAGAAPWAAAAAKGTDHWSVEMRIPFPLLGVAGEVKAGRFLFNLCRAAGNNPENERLSSYAPVSVSFAQVGRFAELTFKDAPPTPDALALAQKDLDRLDRWLREKLWRAANVKEAFLADREGDASVAAFLALKRQAGARLAGRDFANAGAFLAQYEALKAELTVPTKKLTFAVDTRGTKAPAVWVNGSAVAAAGGQWSVRLTEGLNVIGVTATADGKAPGLRVRVSGQSELETRWRVGVATGDAWKAAAFDDRAWAKAELDKDGYLLVPAGLTGAVCFRQLVLWAENHTSALPCLQPKVREWGFSEGSLETLFHTLYAPPPLASALEEYEFILDVPNGFRLLDEDYAADGGGGQLIVPPRSVTRAEANHGDLPYSRYRFAVESGFVQPEKLRCLLIPLVLGEYTGTGRSCTFYFHRLALGNLTELEQALPVRILPPLNGRRPKRVMLSQYCAEPWVRMYCGKLYPNHFEAFMRQALDVGFTHWILPPGGDAYTRKVYDRVLERGGAVVLWGPNNYPLYGNTVANGALAKLMLDTPEFGVRYFSAPERLKGPGQFCRSYATGAGAARFKEALKKDIGAMLNGSDDPKFIGFPKTTLYWNDWEQSPMDGETKRWFCFCDHCKSAFRQQAGLPDTADLADESIHKTYKKEWCLFRSGLDGRVNGIVRDVCHELGLQYMYYDGVDRPDRKANWPHLRGKIDIAFPGWPGDGQAVGYGAHDGVGTFPVDQQSLDGMMAFVKENTGLPQITGQLFASSAYGLKKPLQAWPQSAITGRDGFLNVARLKPSILRIVASFHGGLDLDTAVERCAGQLYYIGEATRAISDFEELFYAGTRQDDLAASAQVKYPNLLVLTKGDERLVLIFNEGAKPLDVELENRDVKPGQTAAAWGLPGTLDSPVRMKVTIPADDVVLVHIR